MPESVIVAVWGGSSSNAYSTLEEVNEFINTRVFDHSEWEALSKIQKEAAILEATRDIDAGSYVGGLYSVDQALVFPRAFSGGRLQDSVAREGLLSGSHMQSRMERDVKEALAYQANWIARSAGRNFHAENQAQGIKSYSESVGPIREQYTYGAAVRRLCPEAAAKVSTWAESKKIFRG